MALCLKHRVRYEYSIGAHLGAIQDWVQLPTKTEMDSYRKQNARTHFVCKQKLIVTSKTWENKRVNLRRTEGVK